MLQQGGAILRIAAPRRLIRKTIFIDFAVASTTSHSGEKLP